jgi:hypothetical protein
VGPDGRRHGDVARGEGHGGWWWGGPVVFLHLGRAAATNFTSILTAPLIISIICDSGS